MTTPIYESISRFNIGPWRVRVWREEAALGASDNRDLQKLNDELIAMMVHIGETPEAGELLKLFGAVERVSAVEVVDADGDGHLNYPLGFP